MKPTLTALLAFLTLSGAASRLEGAVLGVPAPYPTIQGAINAAAAGDTVLVEPGTYNESIDFLGKAITVTSSGGPGVTVIHATTIDSVVAFRSVEQGDSVLDGFTIENGKGTCLSVPGLGAVSAGGGIFCDDGASPTIHGNVITGNRTGGTCSFAYRYGAGIALLANSHASITECVITGNTLSGDGFECKGGGVYVGPGSTAVLSANDISGNTTCAQTEAQTRSGGGIACDACAPVIDGNTLGGNSARDGGGVFCLGMTGGRIKNNDVTGNAAESGGGVAVWSDWPHDDADLLISQNVISQNSATKGGGILLLDTSVTVRLNEVTGNTAVQGGGLAVLSDSYGRSEIKRNRILHNQADTEGGGIYSYAADSHYVNNVIAFNAAGMKGGGIYNLNGYPEPTFVNDTFFGNDADYRGGGIFHSSDDVMTVADTIVWGNTARLDPSIYGGLNPTVDATYSDVEGGWPGAGNLDADPLLAAPGRDDFHLRLGSPCADSASPAVPLAPPNDLEGDARPMDGDMDGTADPDMGADELVAEAAVLFGTVNAGAGDLADVLLLNGGPGDRRREVSVPADGPLVLEMLLPPGGGSGKYVVHADAGRPDATGPSPTLRSLPAGIGWIAFPLLFSDGAAPVAVFNNLGKEGLVGSSMYFDGTPLPPPPRAPAVFLDLPGGDPVNLPPGTVLTFQGVILDPATAATKPGSVTNGMVVTIL